MFKIGKIAILVFGLLTLASCSTANSTNNDNAVASAKIGGWAPVFISSFDEASFSDVAQSYRNGHIDSVAIVYYTDKEILAKQISEYLTLSGVPNESVLQREPTANDTATYDTSKVVLILRFSDKTK